jgi:hypothetical protein
MIVTDEPTYREPDYSEEGVSPYEEGVGAHHDGLDVSDNPYHRIHQEVAYEDWQRGWMDVEEGEVS